MWELRIQESLRSRTVWVWNKWIHTFLEKHVYILKVLLEPGELAVPWLLWNICHLHFFWRTETCCIQIYLWTEAGACFSVAVGGVSHSHNPSSLRIPDANEICGRLKGLWEGNKFSVAFTPSLLPVLLPSNLLPMHATMICFPFSWKAEDFPTYSVLPFNLEAQDFLFHIWGWSIL